MRKFVIPCCDVAKCLQLLEQVFYQMPLLIKPPVTCPPVSGIFSGGDGWISTPFPDILDELTAVISPVSKYIAAAEINMVKHRDRIIYIVALPFAYHKINRIAIGIYNGMDFGAGSSAAVSNRSGSPPFLAPALCWCA